MFGELLFSFDSLKLGISYKVKNHLQMISLLCRQGENQELIEYYTYIY